MDNVPMNHTFPMVDMNKNQRSKVSMTLALVAQKENMNFLHCIPPFANLGL
jgi:hypothetical protein